MSCSNTSAHLFPRLEYVSTGRVRGVGYGRLEPVVRVAASAESVNHHTGGGVCRMHVCFNARSGLQFLKVVANVGLHCSLPRLIDH